MSNSRINALNGLADISLSSRNLFIVETPSLWGILQYRASTLIDINKLSSGIVTPCNRDSWYPGYRMEDQLHGGIGMFQLDDFIFLFYPQSLK